MDKFAIALISPLGTSLALGGLALLMARLGRARRAWWLGVVALVWVGLWSLPVASQALRRWLEAPYPAVAVRSVPPAQALVVLGGGIEPAGLGGQWPDLSDGADRVWHAARLYQAGTAPWVVLSGGSNPAVSATSEAQAMRMLLLDLGVPASALLLEERSRNTRQNAAYTAELLRGLGVQRVVLVTSALHMRRAVALFEAEGLQISPAAADHSASSPMGLHAWLPDADALDGSARALKELVGRAMGR